MHQRLPNRLALALFSSDALSSVAYAGQEILVILALAGAAALTYTWPISLLIALLLFIVVNSYRQTIKAYPAGGGSYLVTKDNLGTIPSLVAAASLLVDYVLTVAVSISAGTAAITSAFPMLYKYRVIIAVSFVVILSLANLRGMKEAGAIFAAPTYAFIVIIGITIVYGIFSYYFFGPQSIQVPSPETALVATEGLTLFLLARAFSSGCTAMTGIEAVAGSVKALREPEWINGRKILAVMAAILIFLFLGLAWLATHSGVIPSETETVISQMSRAIYGTNFMYYLVSFSTAAILVLAANTGYADFPRQASMVARDDFLPRRFKELGRRLVFSNGVIALSIAAITLIIIFKASTTLLIPLYAVGVFTSFTLSQSGMVMHHINEREEGWKMGVVINSLGAISTLTVLLIIAITKFTTGAWMVLIVIPALIAMFLYIKRHYEKSEQAAAIPEDDVKAEFAVLETNRKNHVVVLAKDFDKRLLLVLRYAKTNLKGDIRALHIAQDPESTDIEDRWKEVGIEVPLDVVYSPYRELIRPLLQYIRGIRNPGDVVTVVLGEFAPDDAVDAVLHDHISTTIKWALFKECRTVCISVPFTFDYRPLAPENRERALDERAKATAVVDTQVEVKTVEELLAEAALDEIARKKDVADQKAANHGDIF